LEEALQYEELRWLRAFCGCHCDLADFDVYQSVNTQAIITWTSRPVAAQVAARREVETIE
jgi:hypothetical protein